MNKEQKDLIKVAIEEEIKKTERSIQEYKELTKPIVPDCAIGRISRMDAIVNQNVSKTALRKAENKMKNLIYAQNNIHKEGFGICSHCGQDIPMGRILLVPHSRYCVKCAH